MSKREYLAKLREYLSYELPERLVLKNLDYYSNYIDQEADKGRGVQDVLEDLGDPQLIARSIIDAAKSGADGIPYTDDDQDFSKEIYGQGNSSGGYGNASGGYGSETQNGSRQSYGSGQGGFGGNEYGSGSGSGSDSFGDNYGQGGSGWDIRHFNFGCFPVILLILVFFSVLSLISGILTGASPFLSAVCMVLLILWLLNRGNRRA